MANMQMRDKLRKITAAAKNGEDIPEHSKKIGMTFFYVLTGIGIASMIAFAAALLIYGYRIGAFISFIVALLISYMTYKILSAEDIPKS